MPSGKFFPRSNKKNKKKTRPVQAYLSYAKAHAVDFVKKEGLLMAPAYAVPMMLRDAGLTLADFDYYEIHEAFAAQVLRTLAAWESAYFCRDRLGLAAPLGAIDRARLNVVGSSLAIGHPFAATGALPRQMPPSCSPSAAGSAG